MHHISIIIILYSQNNFFIFLLESKLVQPKIPPIRKLNLITINFSRFMDVNVLLEI